MKIFAVLAGTVLTVAVLLGAGLKFHSQDHRISVLNSQLVASQRTQRAQTQAITGLLANSGSDANDPLSAYNQICNEDFTNSTTGNDQTYYFPCTNNAQTIPQPGN